MPYMTEGIVKHTSRIFSSPKSKAKQPIRKHGKHGKHDYKVKLWNTPVDAAGASANGNGSANGIDCTYTDRLQNVVSGLQGSVACQSVAIAVLQTLNRVLERERLASKAAISLAQGEKLERMIQTSEAALDALEKGLNAQGNHMLNLCADADVAPPEDSSWWFALTETIETIENGTQRILSLASAQPKGGPARQLSTIAVQLLRNKHHQLLSEADAWIS